jgi:hypothetical protein
MTAIQLELPFMQEDTDSRLMRYQEQMDSRFEKNRKALHAKNAAITKEVQDIRLDLEMLKAAICKGQMVFKF